MAEAVAVLIGYVLGSVPVALIVARRHGVDLYRTSDGNPGAWNALEQLGGRRAWPAFIGDGLKGTLAGGAGLLLGGFAAGWAGVLGALVGHAFPAFARLKGGKSVMAFVGGVFALVPLAAFASLALCGAVSALRSFTLGARVGVVALVPATLALHGVERLAAVGALMTVVGGLFVARRQ